MPVRDEAITLKNTRLLSAVYFALLAVIATIIIDTLLYSLGTGEVIPIFKAVLLAVVIAALFGALFGERIIHCKKPFHWRAFGWGFLMVLSALPFYTLGLVWLMSAHHQELFSSTTFTHLFYLYLYVLFFSLVLFGIWLAIAGGLAAMYLRSRLIYYILHTDEKTQPTRSTHRKKAVKTQIKHA